jgi:hypothetical protein
MIGAASDPALRSLVPSIMVPNQNHLVTGLLSIIRCRKNEAMIPAPAAVTQSDNKDFVWIIVIIIIS